MILRFGKHRGKTVAEVAEEAPDYLEWIRDNEDMKKDPRNRQLMAAINAELGSGRVDDDGVVDDGLVGVRLKQIEINWLLTTLKDDESDEWVRIRHKLRGAK